jgi:arylsulfatase A-like enzyme
MILWLFTSILAGTLLTAEEFVFILLTCGPFWLGPGMFFKTWAIYCLISLAISYGARVLIFSIPVLRNKPWKPKRKLIIDFFASWLIGSILLLTAILSDLDYGHQHWLFIATTLCLGTLTLWLFSRDLRRPKLRSFHLISLSLSLIVLTHLALFISDLYYAQIVHERNELYDSPIPHVSLIVLDTVRGDHLSCNGYPFWTTPHLDEIANDGLLCTNAFSSTNWTPPGHISIFTGKYPSQHGNDGQAFMPGQLVSLTEILRRGGYFCMAMYSNPLAGENIDLTRGFDSDIGVHISRWVHPLWMKLVDKFVFRDHGARATFSMALETFRWIQRKGGHLFIYMNLLEPHASYVKHEPFFSEFVAAVKMSQIPNLAQVEGLCDFGGEINFDSTYFSGYTEASYQYLRSVYDSEIAYVDHHLGRFSEGLRYARLLDKTLLVVTSDHGEALGEHVTRGHHTVLFDPVIRIPLILRYPQGINPAIMDAPVSNVDIFPTVLNLLDYGEYIPEDVEGIDLLSAELVKDRPILIEDYNPTIENLESDWVCYSLLQGGYKLILSVNTDSAFLEKFPFDTLLINLEKDSAETVDLHRLQPGVTDSMMVRLKEWVARIYVAPDDDVVINEVAAEALKSLGYVR